MKKILILLSVVFTTLSYAQNNGVILAPNYIPNIGSPSLQPLPLAQDYFGAPISLSNTNPDWGYAGQAATSASNIMLDVSGDILFFIVDDYIYDKNGQFIHKFPNLGVGGGIRGASEISIIPAPGDCNKYYIVTTFLGDDNANSQFQKTPYYFLLDMNATNINAYTSGDGCLYSGALVSPADMTSLSGDATPFTVPGSTFFPAGEPSGDKNSGVFFGTTTLNTNNSRYFFITNGYGVYTYELDQMGFNFMEFNPITSNGFNPSTVRSELEVVQLNNGDYRIAVPYQTEVGFGPNPINQGIYTAEVSSTGQLNTSTIRRFTFYREVGMPSLSSRVRGVEFSEDGNILYITHTLNSLELDALEYFDFQNPTPDLIPIATPPNVDFQYSMIERTFNNRLLIANENGIYTLADASNPNSTISLLTSFNYPANYESLNPNPPQTQKMYVLQDQIDDMDYNEHFLATTACCKRLNAYDIKQYSVSQSAIWEDNATGSNPIITGNGNTIVIRNELRIPANTNLVIRNMTLQFAPGARLVIENGVGSSGGSLVLDGTTLTVDDRCGTDEMWLGVEVWANQNQSQNNTQGRLTMVNNAQIEHAWVGVLLSKRDVLYDNSDLCQLEPIFQQNSFINANNGGIINASNSTFYNNQRGVYFRPYFAPNGTNNQSVFTKTNFYWDGILKENAPLLELARLEEVKGIRFKGCHFSNVQPGLYNYTLQGFGIVSRESQFHVSPQCNVPQPFGTPCTNQTVSLFDGLIAGVYATIGSGLSFSVKESNFVNNRLGIFTVGVQLEEITENNFEVRETNSYQTAGLVMAFSRDYKVQENNFTYYDDPLIPITDAESYGIVVNFSGPYENLIYKNDFSNLKIGGQTESINAIEITTTNFPTASVFNMSGLIWQCNDFQTNIDEHDLTLMKGRMNYNQGYHTGGNNELLAKRATANNLFSLDNEVAIDHDLFLDPSSQVLSYAYLSLPRHTPDSFTANLVDINSSNFVPTITNDNGACPSKLAKKSKSFILNKIDILSDNIEDKEELLEEGAEEDLLEDIAEESPGEVKNELLEHSPYLSDEVLLAYIASNPPSGHLKQVMIANSQLSEQVKAALANVNMPNGTANQIQAAQAGLSGRTLLNFELNFLKGERTLLFNDMVRNSLLDESVNANLDEVIEILDDEGESIESKKLLYKMYLIVRDSVHAEETLQDLIALGVSPRFIELCMIQKELSSKESTCAAIDADVTLRTNLETIRTDFTDKEAGAKAGCLLDIHATPIIPLFLVESSAIMLGTSDEEKKAIDLSRSFEVSIYPNPSTGLVTFDFPENEEGELKITVIDLTGKIMHTEAWGETNGQQIDLSNLHKGLYLVKISIDNVVVETQSLKLQ